MLRFALSRARYIFAALLLVALAAPRRAEAQAAGASVALDRLALPASDEGLPGSGPIRRLDWFQRLWLERRTTWARTLEQDRGAVVFLGDSITQGWGGGLAAAFPGVKVANRGISGDTTRGVLVRLQEDVLALHPAAVVLLIGTNDLEMGATPEEAADNVRRILGALEQHNKHMPIVLNQVFPSSATKSRPADQIKALNALLRAAVKNDAQVTNLETWPLFATSEGDAIPAEFPDLLHPNELGYAKWAAALRPLFATYGFTETTSEPFLLEDGFESLFNGRDLTGWGYRLSSEADKQGAARAQTDPNAPARPIVAEPKNFDALRLDKPEFRIHVDRDRAADLGVDTTDVASSIRIMVGGDDRVTRFRDDTTNEDYDVQLRLEKEYRGDPETISRLYVPSQGGRLVRLDNVVRIEQGLAPSRIERLDRQRSVRLFAGVGPGYALGDRVAALRKALADMNLPAAYSVSVLGRGREMERTFAEFGMAFLLSIAFMYMILASQFESLADPLTILISLPLAVPFALLSLWATSDTLNLYSALGVLVLFGIVKKNSILQIDHMNNLRRQHGLSRDEAVMQGNRDRLRPILMTTLALVAGMLPLLLGTGPGAEERRSIAIVVIGGQTLSLLLTLLATPVFYTLFEDAAASPRWRALVARFGPPLEALSSFARRRWQALVTRRVA